MEVQEDDMEVQEEAVILVIPHGPGKSPLSHMIAHLHKPSMIENEDL